MYRRFWICKSLIFIVALVFSLTAIAQLRAEDVKVDINKATAQELSSLPGIGEKKAELIVAFRNEHGNFSSVDGLKDVDGIGKKTIEKLRELIFTDGQ